MEKYAVRVGGGHNHRFGQADAWMIKDNHKNFFGGIKKALNFFKSMQTYYNPIIVEIHSLDEYREAMELNVVHVMLDNFTPEQIRQAVALKTQAYDNRGFGRINFGHLRLIISSKVSML